MVFLHYNSNLAGVWGCRLTLHKKNVIIKQKYEWCQSGVDVSPIKANLVRGLKQTAHFFCAQIFVIETFCVKSVPAIGGELCHVSGQIATGAR